MLREIIKIAKIVLKKKEKDKMINGLDFSQIFGAINLYSGLGGIDNESVVD